MTMQATGAELTQHTHIQTALSRVAAGFSASAAVTLCFNALLTIVKDAYEPLHDVMQKVTGHHWTTHGIVILVVFVVLGWVLSKNEAVTKMSDTALLGSVLVATLINGGAIALWFLLF